MSGHELVSYFGGSGRFYGSSGASRHPVQARPVFPFCCRLSGPLSGSRQALIDWECATERLEFAHRYRDHRRRDWGAYPAHRYRDHPVFDDSTEQVLGIVVARKTESRLILVDFVGRQQAFRDLICYTKSLASEQHCAEVFGWLTDLDCHLITGTGENSMSCRCDCHSVCTDGDWIRKRFETAGSLCAVTVTSCDGSQRSGASANTSLIKRTKTCFRK